MSAPDISREAVDNARNLICMMHAELRPGAVEREILNIVAEKLLALRAALDAAERERNAAIREIGNTAREATAAAIRALPPPSDAMAALAEVARVAVEREREAICALIQEVEFPEGGEHEHDACSDYADRIAAAIRARSEGEGA
jgi:hypothetical protein